MRHGETEDNVNQIMQGQTQGRLTERGVEQAHEVAERMRREHIDAFFASDLRRSIDTCRIIAEPHGKPIETTPLLRERDWGGFTGMFIPDLKDRTWPDDIETIGQTLICVHELITHANNTNTIQNANLFFIIILFSN